MRTLRRITIACIILFGIVFFSSVNEIDQATQQTVSSQRPWKFSLLFLAAALISEIIRFVLNKAQNNFYLSRVTEKLKPDTLDSLKNTYVANGELEDALLTAINQDKVRIGFHSLRNQKELILALKLAGFKKGLFDDTRNFIRELLINDRRAFALLKPYIYIDMIHNGKSCGWDGDGNRCSGQRFFEAEVLYSIDSSASNLFKNLLEGVTN